MRSVFVETRAPRWTHNYEIINYNRTDVHRSVEVFASKEELGSLEADGFLKVDGMFDAGDVARLREATDRIVDLEMARGDREYYPGNGIFVRYLIDKDPLFQHLLTYRPILSVVRAMLGPQIQLMDLVARVTFMNEPQQRLMWHIHNRVVPDPLPPFFAHPHGLDALVYLDDSDETTGGLCVLPGSHREVHRKMEFGDHRDKEGQKVVFTKAGDTIFAHPNLWHRVTPSTGQRDERRRVLLLGFMPAWFKKEFPKGIRPTEPLGPRRRRGRPRLARALHVPDPPR